MEDQNVVMSKPSLFSGKSNPVALFLLTAFLSFAATKVLDAVFPQNSIHPATIFGFSASFVLGLVLQFVIGIIPGYFDGQKFLLWAAAPLYYPVLRLWIDTAIDPTSHNLWPFEILILFFGSGIVLLGALLGRFLGKKFRSNDDRISAAPLSRVSKIVFGTMAISVIMAFGISLLLSFTYHPPAILGPGPTPKNSKTTNSPEDAWQNREFSDRLMEASNKGLLPRHLSDKEAETLGQEIAIVSDKEYKQGYTGDQLTSELYRLDAMCRSLTGLSWDQLLVRMDPGYSGS